jgi:hypothetical protein
MVVIRIHDDYSLADAHLRCGQSHARSSIHGLQHVAGEASHLPGDFRNGLGLAQQNGIGIDHNSAYHHLLSTQSQRCSGRERVHLVAKGICQSDMGVLAGAVIEVKAW